MYPDYSTSGVFNLVEDNSNNVNSDDVNIDTEIGNSDDPGDVGDLGDLGDSASPDMDNTSSDMEIDDDPAAFINLIDQLVGDLAFIAKPDPVSFEDVIPRDNWQE